MRPASTYRGARRNAALRGDPKGVWRGIDFAVDVKGEPYVRRLVHPPVRPNASGMTALSKLERARLA